MKASKTELLSLFKQAFEACGLDSGGYESAAEMLVWCEMHGLKAFETITGRVSEFAEPPRPAIEIMSDQPHSITVNAHASSTIVWADLVSDLIFAKASTGNYCAGTILNCHERLLIIRQMVEMTKRHMYGFAYWQPVGKRSHMLQINTLPGRDGPELLTIKTAGQTTGALPPQSMLLVYSRSEIAARKHIAKNYPCLSGEVTERVTPESMHEHFQQALTEGIEISELLWRELGSQASKLLVESSDESRSGAGA